MSDGIKDGGAAFPQALQFIENNGELSGNHSWSGLTIRDYFAGQALAGMMANETTPFSADHAEVDPQQLAEAVYEIADALLTERNKGGQ